jgi:diguanylate cyclase (GGDEF)-like protein/PAS domain S-box-containing protein
MVGLQHTQKNPRVLLVDDSPGDLFLITTNLKLLAYDIHTVTNPDCVLEQAKTFVPDVILLDVQMPRINGFEVCDSLKKEPLLQEIPVLFLTALGDIKAKIKGFEVGGVDYLVKPVQPAELRARVSTQLKLREISRELVERNTLLQKKIIELEQVQAALIESESRIQSVLNNAAVCISMLDLDGRYELVNSRCAALFGYHRDTMAGMNCLEIIDPAFHDQTRSTLRDMLNGTREQSFRVKTYKRADGSLFPGGCYLSLQRDISGNCTGFVCVITDLSEQVKSEAELRLAQTVFDTCSEGLLVTDAENHIVMVNPAFTRITGYSAQEALGNNPCILQSGRHDREYYREMWQYLMEQDCWEGEIWNRRKNGEIYPQWLSISVIRNKRKQIVNYLAIFADITQRKKVEAVLRRQALHDQLTGLPNRALFDDNLHRALIRAKRQKNMVALLYIDVDDFKNINDRLGHLTGDKALQLVAEWLKKCLRDQDVVARLGGDEFAIILSDISKVGQAAGSAERILSTPVLVNDEQGAEWNVSFSIGVALYPVHADCTEQLLRRADDAMYIAKHQGKGCYHIAGEEAIAPVVQSKESRED